MSKLNNAARAAANDSILSANDAARLEIMAFEESGAVREWILSKLTDATIVSGDIISADVATIGSVLRYQIGIAEIERRTLSLPDVSYPNGQFINLLTPVGLALLGCRAGSAIFLRLPDGGQLKIHLHEVEFQPEAEVRRRSTLMPDNGPGAA